jgi:hypothetical protein
VVGAVPARNVRRTGDDLAVRPDGVNAVTAPSPQVVPRDAEQEAAGHGKRSEERVRHGHQGSVVGEDGPGVGHDGPAVDHVHAHGVLHPTVGDDDEVGGEE